MSLTKAEVRAAFKEAGVRSYAHIPPDEEIDHVFSDGFYRRMGALIEEERRGSWRLLSRRRRCTLIVAAILATSFLLAACTPKLREAVTEFVVSIYEKFIDYGTQTEIHDKLESIYVLNPIPEGFEFVSQTQPTAYYVATVYQDSHGIKLKLSQATSESLVGSLDAEQGEMLIVGDGSLSVFIYSSEKYITISWILDGYYMNLSYWGLKDSEEMISLISSLSLAE